MAEKEGDVITFPDKGVSPHKEINFVQVTVSKNIIKGQDMMEVYISTNVNEYRKREVYPNTVFVGLFDQLFDKAKLELKHALKETP